MPPQRTCRRRRRAVRRVHDRLKAVVLARRSVHRAPPIADYAPGQERSGGNVPGPSTVDSQTPVWFSGITPSCWRAPSMSISTQRSTILPSAIRRMVIPVAVNSRCVAGIPNSSPEWTPCPVTRITTLSPSAMMSSIRWVPGDPERNMRNAAFKPSKSGVRPGEELWSTKSAETY